jgi:hypothetical protein
MKRVLVVMYALGWTVVLLLLLVPLPHSKAQTISPPIMIQSTIPHTACVATPNVTTYCFGSDGLYVSLTGAAFVQLNAPAGVTSVTVCNAAGAVCAPPATGPVTLNIPKTASLQ